jgi:Fur family ferric uptake transcriptional regulator
MAEAEKILEALKEHGHRMTKVRRAMLDILCKSKVPISAAEIINSLKRRSLDVNKTTVYREIDFLQAEKILREVDLLDGKKRYEVLGEHDHHHHMICTACKAIRCMDMHNDLDELEAEIMRKFHFKVTSHTLEFFGVCENCQ